MYVPTLLTTICFLLVALAAPLAVQQLGVCSDMAHSLLPVQLSVNIYMGNITYLRCPSTTYSLLISTNIYIYVDSNIILNYTLAPND